MSRTIALITAGCFALVSPTALAAPDDTPPSGHFIDENGREIDYELWVENGVRYGDARVSEVDGDYVEIWREGGKLEYEGVLNGEPVAGELPANIDSGSVEFCAGWLALVCVGALFLNSGDCAMLEACIPKPPTTNPEEEEGDPEDEGEGGESTGGGDAE